MEGVVADGEAGPLWPPGTCQNMATPAVAKRGIVAIVRAEFRGMAVQERSPNNGMRRWGNVTVAVGKCMCRRSQAPSNRFGALN